ncbi:tether containing UBX domain for GLUT4 [Prorops nasuta]|uniref:tether containing UBX domain for GLUT4 n=1 Tax=Prorops nasuta TaxID=863751 RepID=UPI0034CDCB7A
MATNKNVIILVPNGRRQTVKITPNTTILQILEEACKKYGFNADDYDIKHFNQILDPTTIFRFSGLPNNAQLEMVPCTKKRTVSNITVGIQLESGVRMTNEFLPNATLKEVMETICKEEDLNTAVLIYMQREICGKEKLETTTLQCLGLHSGKAILRLIHRDPGQLKTQAHISAPLAPKVNPTALENENSRKSKPCLLKNELDPLELLKMEKKGLTTQEFTVNNKKVSKVENIMSDVDHCEDKFSSTDNIINNEEMAKEESKSEELIMEEIKTEFLGERNALVYDSSETGALPKDDIPDSFFDLTIEDARYLWRDIKIQREQLEEAPLLTDSQRQLDRDKKILSQLNKYRQTVIRIQFPNQQVLQGIFGPLELVQKIKDFIKSYLEVPGEEFTIYTSPPKHILNLNSRLIDENLVPSAIIYFSGKTKLRPDIKNTDPRVAYKEAVKTRSQATQRSGSLEECMEVDQETESAVPGPSNK